MERLTTELDYCDRFCENNKTKCPIYSHCANREMYARLKEYEDLDEQGKLLKLPCKVGDTLFHVGTNPMRIREFKVFGIDILAESVIISTEEEICFEIEHIGKTFFLTRKDAEKALEKLKGGAEK